MTKSTAALAVLLLASEVWSQGNAKKYLWQEKGTNCNFGMTFCWFGADSVTDPEVTAYGTRWVSQDKDEKPFEWITEVRCIQSLHLCILARNQKNPFAHGSLTNMDLYYVKEWSEYEIRAVGENDLPHGKECEVDSLLLNREDASVSMLSVPGPGATGKACGGVKPKTVMYRLQLGYEGVPPQKETP